MPWMLSLCSFPKQQLDRGLMFSHLPYDWRRWGLLNPMDEQGWQAGLCQRIHVCDREPALVNCTPSLTTTQAWKNLRIHTASHKSSLTPQMWLQFKEEKRCMSQAWLPPFSEYLRYKWHPRRDQILSLCSKKTETQDLTNVGEVGVWCHR